MELAFLFPFIGLLLGLWLSWMFTFKIVVPMIPMEDTKGAKLIGLLLWIFVFAEVGAFLGFLGGGLLTFGEIASHPPGF